MKETENDVFGFPQRKMPRMAFFEVPIRDVSFEPVFTGVPKALFDIQERPGSLSLSSWSGYNLALPEVPLL